jgi:hypothetical protein
MARQVETDQRCLWFVAPYLIGMEFEAVEKVAHIIQQNPPQNSDDRKQIEHRIFQALDKRINPFRREK